MLFSRNSQKSKERKKRLGESRLIKFIKLPRITLLKMGIIDKRYILGGHRHLSTLIAEKDRLGGLIPSFEPTVTGDLLVKFLPGRNAPKTDEGQEEALERIVDYMQTTHSYSNCMQPYEVNNCEVEKTYKELKPFLTRVDPNMEVVICDTAGIPIAGQASNISAGEIFAAGTQCYSLSEAGSVQAIVMNDGKTTVYGIRLTPKHQGAMFAAAKGDIKLLQPIVAAIEDLKKFKKLEHVLSI